MKYANTIEERAFEVICMKEGNLGAYLDRECIGDDDMAYMLQVVVEADKFDDWIKKYVDKRGRRGKLASEFKSRGWFVEETHRNTRLYILSSECLSLVQKWQHETRERVRSDRRRESKYPPPNSQSDHARNSGSTDGA